MQYLNVACSYFEKWLSTCSNASNITYSFCSYQK